MDYREIIDGILKREGDAYTNNPLDRGGPTKFGVTQAVARAFGYQGDMRDLTIGIARAIYIDRYWLQPRFDQVFERNPPMADEMMDTGVNMGTIWPGKFLQRALNVLNNEQKLFPDITVDGAIGKMTLAALDAFIAKRGSVGYAVVTRMMDSQQSVRYMEIAESNKTQESFVYGWQLNRTGVVNV